MPNIIGGKFDKERQIKWYINSGVVLTLAACGNSNNNNCSHPNFKESTPKKTIKDGGKVSVTVVIDTSFTDIFNDELSTNNT